MGPSPAGGIFNLEGTHVRVTGRGRRRPTPLSLRTDRWPPAPLERWPFEDQQREARQRPHQSPDSRESVLRAHSYICDKMV